jgi:cation diffusion facilitator family transporter
MNTLARPSELQSADVNTQQQVRRVFILTLILNLLVAAAKIGIGVLIGALSITADGFHSLTDAASNVVALIALSVASQPPDEQHPYGHQRFETIGALGIGLLLFFTAWETLGGVIERLQGGAPPQFSASILMVMLVTLVINIGVNRYQMRESQRLNSQLLAADAANTGADIFVTLSVMTGGLLILLFDLYWIDIVVALAVTVLIARAAWQIVRRTGSVLVDTAPFEPERIREAAQAVLHGERIEQVRSRGSQEAAYIDLEITAESQSTTEETALTARLLQQHLRETFPGVQEVRVDFTPAAVNEDENYRAVVARLAALLGFSAHHIYMNQTDSGHVLELHVEVEAGQPLSEAHANVTRLEGMLHKQLPDIADVITHIEPASESHDVPTEIEAQFATIQHRVYELLNTQFVDVDWHHLQLHAQPRGIGLTLHAGLPQTLSVAEAHDLAAEAERLLRHQISGLDRVTIHTEPRRDRSSANGLSS